jgi:glycosyltransferase involved in cell wall biosynthesis
VAAPKVKVSVVVPVYNEAKILPTAAAELVETLETSGWDYEVIFAENGSSDDTNQILEALTRASPRLHALHETEPNYGRALKHAILEARGDYVICEEIDLLNDEFHQNAMKLLLAKEAEMVVGSKAAKGANDERGFVRQKGTVVLNGLLRLSLGYKGTDTHGLKAFRREPLLPVARACIVERDLFASEFVIRAYQMGVDVKEIPVSIREKRRPSVHLFRRVPKVLSLLGRLVWVMRVKGAKGSKKKPGKK